jgi:hypothetical protein
MSFASAIYQLSPLSGGMGQLFLNPLLPPTPRWRLGEFTDGHHICAGGVKTICKTV